MHIQSDVTCLYIPKRNGGRGLINICEQYKNTIINFDAYLLKSEDLLKIASDWQTTRGDKSLHTKAACFCGEIDKDLNNLITLTKQQRKNKLKVKRTTFMGNTLSAKELHGQHTRLIRQPEIDEDASMRWLKSSTLKKATELMNCEIQEQAITTRYIQKRSTTPQTTIYVDYIDKHLKQSTT